jgi:pSer/pThr/pTyr-binding forkhead associated (FHA) protein
MVRFVISYNNEHLKTYEINEPAITVGRLPENTISIANMGVSRRHLRIESDASGTYILADLNSLNGTYINNKRVKTAPLANGDIISIGKYSIVFETGEATAHKEDQAPAAHPAAPTPAPEEETVAPVDSPAKANDDVLEEVAEASTPPSGTTVPPAGEGAVNRPVLIETTKHVVYKLDKALITIGNSEGDDVYITGFMMSDGYAQVEKKDDGIWISARKMGGKVKVNGKSVRSHKLEHKDRIEIGKSTFRFMENE